MNGILIVGDGLGTNTQVLVATEGVSQEERDKLKTELQEAFGSRVAVVVSNHFVVKSTER